MLLKHFKRTDGGFVVSEEDKPTKSIFGLVSFQMFINDYQI